MELNPELVGRMMAKDGLTQEMLDQIYIALDTKNFSFTGGAQNQRAAMQVIKEMGTCHPRIANAEIAFFGRRLTEADNGCMPPILR